MNVMLNRIFVLNVECLVRHQPNDARLIHAILLRELGRFQWRVRMVVSRTRLYIYGHVSESAVVASYNFRGYEWGRIQLRALRLARDDDFVRFGGNAFERDGALDFADSIRDPASRRGPVGTD